MQIDHHFSFFIEIELLRLVRIAYKKKMIIQSVVIYASVFGS